MGFSNCTRVLVYSAVSSRAVAQTPASTMHSAVVAYSVMQSMMAAPSAPSPTSRSAPTRTPSSSTIASGRPVVVVCRVSVTPSARRAPR